ncbi:hypothetical protein A2U01_0098293, partial [Trifolium medium]|nr:hypothetical protein [Trifolium medium]
NRIFWVASVLGAARRQGFRKLGWHWTLRNAQPWMAQRATLRAGVALAIVDCATRSGAGAARGRDAYL